MSTRRRAFCDRRWWGITLLVAGTLVLLVTAAAWAVGELTQKPGTAGCVSETGTAAHARTGRRSDSAVLR